MFISSSPTSTTCADSDTVRAIIADILDTRSQPTPTISDTVIPTSLAVDTGFLGSHFRRLRWMVPSTAMAVAVAAPNSPPPQRTNNDTKPAPMENEAMNVLSA